MGRRLVVFVFVFSLLIEFCESNKALRKLNRKFNLLKETVERDITDLKYEVADLQAELEFEKARSNDLELLLNNSDSRLQGQAGSDDIGAVKLLKKQLRQQDDTIALLEKDVKTLQANNAELHKMKDISRKQEQALAVTMDSVKTLNEDLVELKSNLQNDSEQISVLKHTVGTLDEGLTNKVMESLAVITKAFHAEKGKLREQLQVLAEEDPEQTDINLELAVESALNSSVLFMLSEINQSCEIVQQHANGLKTKLSQITDKLNKESMRISSNEMRLKVLNDSCKRTCADPLPVTAITTAPPPTTVPPKNTNYTVYALYGKDIATNIRIGSRVIRGKDWTWRNQDNGGPGTVTGWLGNKKEQVYVKWDFASRANYRVGSLGKYDLYIITGGSDAHLSGADILRFKPIFKEDLEEAIIIGSRVIRGEDWSWGNQDDGGPGTVVKWYAGRKSSQQVIVQWDGGQKVNYRVGAHGKYDLFLLADN